MPKPSPMDPTERTRRTLLLVGFAGVAVLAGCTDDGREDDDDGPAGGRGY